MASYEKRRVLEFVCDADRRDPLFWTGNPCVVAVRLQGVSIGRARDRFCPEETLEDRPVAMDGVPACGCFVRD